MKRQSIKEKKNNIFLENDEKRRLKEQQKLLFDFDMEVFQKFLSPQKEYVVLDLGCGDGSVLLSRLKNYKVKKYLGIDLKDNGENQDKNIYFAQLDLESEDFEEKLNFLMKKYSIEKFDLVNALALLAHLKNPEKVFEIVKKFCAEDCLFFFFNIDDGLNICSSPFVQRKMKLLEKTKFSGYRFSGREVPGILSRAGITNYKLIKSGIDTTCLDDEKKEALFHTIFDFILNSLNKEKEEKTISKEKEGQLLSLQKSYDRILSIFFEKDFFLHFGFMFYVAKMV